MKEKFEPFKELLKALREIRYAIGGKNTCSSEGGGNNIVLPKYVYCSVKYENSSDWVERLLEIDYDGRIYDFFMKLGYGQIDPSQITEEEMINLMEPVNNYIVIPKDFSKQTSGRRIIYTKEQKNTINKDTIIMENEGTITKLNDFVFVDLCDFIVATHIPSTLDIEKGQYYMIMHPIAYDHIMNTPGPGDLPPIIDNTTA